MNVIDLQHTPEQQLLVAAVRDFARDRVAPVGLEADNTAQLPDVFLADLHRMGVFSAVPEEFGGQGLLSVPSWLLAVEELAAADAGLAFTVAFGSLGARLIATAGSAEVKERVLPGLAADPGRRLPVLLFEGYGRAPAEFTTLAESAGGRCLVSGAKVAVLWPGTADAVVIAVDKPGGMLNAFLLGSASGVQTERDDQVAGKLGLRSAQTGDVRLNGTPAIRITDPGRDPLAVQRVVEEGRLTLAAICIGLADAAAEYAARYATQREAFGQPISSYQGVAFPLAELRMRTDAARLAMLRAVDGIPAALTPEALSADVSQALGYAANVAVDAGRIAINTLGGHGFLQDHPAERWYRAATTVSALVCDPLQLELEVL